MKHINTILFLLLSFSTFAQTEQNGLVRELNSNKTPISGVQIKYVGAPATDSDDRGQFTLVFDRSIQLGQQIFLEEIRKKGYEVVNQKELQILNLNKENRLATDIILAKSGVIDSIRAIYSGASIEALRAGLNREKKLLIEELKNARLTNQQYSVQLQMLQENYETQREQLETLANRFARTNFDDVDPVYELALDLYKKGKINQAIVKLESIEPAKRTFEIIKEQERIADAKTQIVEDERKLKEQKTKQITYLRSLADMYSLNFNPDKAEQQFEQLLELDSTNIDILKEAADFFFTQKRYKRGIQLYNLLLGHEALESEVFVMRRLSSMYLSLGKPQESLQVFYRNKINELIEDSTATFTFEFTDSLSNKPISTKENEIADFFLEISEIYLAMSYLDSALKYSIKGIERYRKFFHSDEDFELNQLLTYNKALASLGVIHETMGQQKHAETLYNEAFRNYNYMTENGFSNSRAVLRAKEDVASQIAMMFLNQNKFDSTLFYQKISEKILLKDIDNFPNDFDNKHDLAILYGEMGAVSLEQKDYKEALSSLSKSKELFENLVEQRPYINSYQSNLATSYLYVSFVLRFQQDFERAETYIRKSFDINQKLYSENPKNIGYIDSFANINANLGAFYLDMKNTNEACEYLLEAHELWSYANFLSPKNKKIEQLLNSLPTEFINGCKK